MSIANIANSESQASVTTKLNSMITETNYLEELQALFSTDDDYIYTKNAFLEGYSIDSTIDWASYIDEIKSAHTLGMRGFLLPGGKSESLAFLNTLDGLPGTVFGRDFFRAAGSSLGSFSFDGNGNIQTLSEDVPRWTQTYLGQYTNSTSSLGFRPSETNLWTECEPISSSSGASLPGDIVDINWPGLPFTTGVKLDNRDGTSKRFMGEATVVNTNTYTIAGFLRKDDLTKPTIDVGTSELNDCSIEIGNTLWSNAISSTLTYVGSGVWFFMGVIVSGASTAITGIRKRAGQNPVPITVAGVSIFSGNEFDQIGDYKNYLNHYIVPSTNAVEGNREKDSEIIDDMLSEGLLSSTSNSLVGTIAFQFGDIVPDSSSTGQAVVGLGINEDRSSAIIIAKLTSKIPRLRFAIGGIIQYDVYPTVSYELDNSKVVLVFDETGHKWFLNGIEIYTSAVAIPDTFINTITNASANKYSFNLKGLMYSPTRISDTTAKSLSSWDTFSQMAGSTNYR